MEKGVRERDGAALFDNHRGDMRREAALASQGFEIDKEG
jgi:very-short-patch-repair endonuclease